MNRLISFEPSYTLAIRIEPGQKCSGELVLCNVMHTMPVAFRLQALNKARYTIKPQSGIILPLATLSLEVTYHLPPGSNLPETFPNCEDSFLLHSVVVPGAAVKDPMSSYVAVPNDWFSTKKKQVFIDSGVRVMFVGSSVLAELVKNGYMDDLRDVLESSDPAWDSANSTDSHGQSLLSIAINQSRADIVQLFLEFNANIEGQSLSGSTPLEVASAFGETLIVELLLAHRANTERTESSTMGPIHLATGGGHLDILRLLLLNGADIDSLTKDGKTALHIAVEERRHEFTRLLLLNGAKPDIRNVQKGDTPLHIAACLGDENLVKLLLQHGCNKNIRNRSGKIAYDVAAENGHTRLFDALKLGDSLCAMARKGDVRSISRLIENGAVINGSDQHGWSALHRAVFKGRIETVRLLLEKGIELEAKDEDGYTVLHCAVESGHLDIIELLLKKGANVNARTNKGVSALHMAESLHFDGIKSVLIQSGAIKDGIKQAINPPVHSPFGDDTIVSDHEKVTKNKIGLHRTRALQSNFDRSSVPFIAL